MSTSGRRKEPRKGSLLKIESSRYSRPTATTRSRSSRLITKQASVVPSASTSSRENATLHNQQPQPDVLAEVSQAAETVPANPWSFDSANLPFDENLFGLYLEATEQLPEPPRHPLDNADAEYWYALSNVGAIFRLDKYMFVFQNWDAASRMLEIGVYYHVTRLPRSEETYGITCTCPGWRARYTCCHQRVLAHYVAEIEELPHLAPFPAPPAVFIQFTPFQDRLIFSCGSVSSGSRYDSTKRCIVTFQRSGRWHCQSCRYSDTCKHRPHALAFAAEASLIPEGLQAGIDTHLAADGSENDCENTLLIRAAGRDDGLGLRGSISCLPIPPPRWCSLTSEPSYSAPKVSSHGPYFALDSGAQCCCGLSWSAALFQSELSAYACVQTETQTAVLFDLTNCREVSIELIPCPTCRHSRRFIGPDLSLRGIFNWNNTMLFTHDLLNSFTNAYTASETPFSAFCLTVSRMYMEHGIDVKFCSDDTFVRVWFAFIRIQQLDSGMKCTTCGPSPAIVIADGISLATSTSKLNHRRVRPPTFTDHMSPSIESISSYKARGLPAVTQPDIRSLVNKLLEISIAHAACDLPNTRDLETLYPELYALIDLYFRLGVASPHHKSYRGLIQQIVAPDIVLQLVPCAAIATLQEIAHPDVQVPEWIQFSVPAFGRVVNGYRNKELTIPREVRNIAGWLARRANAVFAQLAQHEPAPPDLTMQPEQWETTGTYYGLPAIRRRRAYPKLRNDSSTLDRDAEEMGDCNKFYKTYSKNNLTGGILVLWCTHSICLGFHSIPVAEGRNDVFSAIYTRFPTAPEIIVYDFACQLAPYCLVREASYFRNTKFLIDEMHAHDHTRCGQACFASNSMQFDDRMRSINTSAAECGNKGMKRIRKSVSFMAFEHAVLFTKAFLDVWNRNAINRLERVYST